MTAAQLIALRTRLKWTQTEAGRQLGCSTRSIANWEQGVHKIPNSIALAASAVTNNLKGYGV